MKHITRCSNLTLTQICQQAIKLETLTAKIKPYLPETLREACYVGSFNHCCLVLVITNPMLAVQLRYSLPELRDTLRKEGNIHQLASIKIHIAT